MVKIFQQTLCPWALVTIMMLLELWVLIVAISPPPGCVKLSRETKFQSCSWKSSHLLHISAYCWWQKGPITADDSLVSQFEMFGCSSGSGGDAPFLLSTRSSLSPLILLHLWRNLKMFPPRPVFRVRNSKWMIYHLFLTMRTVFTKAAELIIKTATIAVELNAGCMMYHMLCVWQRALFTGYMTLERQPHQINYLISIISKDLLNWAARRCNLAPSRAG